MYSRFRNDALSLRYLKAHKITLKTITFEASFETQSDCIFCVTYPAVKVRCMQMTSSYSGQEHP